MNAPNRQLDAGLFQRLAPRQNVLIDAVHERAIEVEQERRATAAFLQTLQVRAMIRLLHLLLRRPSVGTFSVYLARRRLATSMVKMRNSKANAMYNGERES